MTEPPTKPELRRLIRTRLAEMPPSARADASAALCSMLRTQSVWRKARNVLYFSPLPDEPNIWPLVEEALASGQPVTLPRYLPAENRYTLHTIRRGPRTLEPGPFGILEPTLACPEADPKQLDLVLVPGVAFTLAGGRLGRGKGYFDRLLADVPGLKCGVAFDCQIVPEVPLEPHDVHLNCILTPTRWQLVGGHARS